MTKKKKWYAIMCVLMASNVIALVFMNSKMEERRSLKNREKKAEDSLVMMKEEQEKNKLDVENRLLKQETENLNDKVVQVVSYNSEYELLSNVGEKFFSEYFTWENSEQFHKRKENMSSYVDDKLLSNTDVFETGLDDTGQDYIKGTGLQSKYLSSEFYLKSEMKRNAEVINGICKVSYESWFDSKDTKEKSVKLYNIDYNKKENKIVGLSLVSDIGN